MSAHKKKAGHLSPDDQKLWTRVARSATPLAQKARNLEVDMAAMIDQVDAPTPPPPPVFPKPKKVRNDQRPDAKLGQQTAPPKVSAKSSLPQPIDPPVIKKLAKGKQPIDGRIDLHGMTQERARSALLDFLMLSHAAGHRIVLVITGKGNLGTGVLKQRVPDWLSLSPFSDLVNGYRVAHGPHGGEGALYVRLRRRRVR